MAPGICHFEVFCSDDEPYEPGADITDLYDGDELTLSRFERGDDPERFAPPAHSAPPDRARTFRTPPALRPELERAIARASACYAIEAEIARPGDLSFLEAAMAMAFAIAEDRDGVIVDRTSSIAYTAAEFGPQAEDPEVRDTVSIEETARGGRVALRTRGMSKFAEADLVIDDFPLEHVELARRLLYDNLCSYSAFQKSLEPGQTMQYRRGDNEAFLFFSPVEPGLLRVSDCAVKAKAPIEGLDRFIDKVLPMMREQLAKEAFESAAADVATALEGGDDDAAMAAADQCLSRAPDSVWALSMAVDIRSRLIQARPDDVALRRQRDELAARLLEHDSQAWSARTAKAGALIDAQARAVLASDPEAALAAADRAAALVAAAPAVQLARAEALYRVGDTEAAFAVLAWLDSLRADGFADRIDAGLLASYRDWRASPGRGAVKPPRGAEPPVVQRPPDVDEEATEPDEALSELEQLRLRAVDVGRDGWERARNAALVGLMLEAPVAVDDLRTLRFGQLDLDSGHARFGDGFLELEHDTTLKLQYWFSVYRAEPAVASYRGPQYAFCRDDLSPLSEDEIERILGEAGGAAGVDELSTARIAATLEIQGMFDDDDDDEDDDDDDEDEDEDEDDDDDDDDKK